MRECFHVKTFRRPRKLRPLTHPPDEVREVYASSFLALPLGRVASDASASCWASQAMAAKARSNDRVELQGQRAL